MLRIRTPSLGSQGSNGDGAGSAAGTATVAGVGSSLADGAGSSAGTATAAGVGSSLADSAGSAAGSATGSGVGSSLADAVGGGAGTSTVNADGDTISELGDGAAAGTSTAAGVGASYADAVGTAAGSSTAAGVYAQDQEAFPDGGFLPDDYEAKDRRRKAIRATLEAVAAPKPAAVAQEMREALAPAEKPAPVLLRDAVKPETMARLRELAEGATARRALDDDDEDVLMLLGV